MFVLSELINFAELSDIKWSEKLRSMDKGPKA